MLGLKLIHVSKRGHMYQHWCRFWSVAYLSYSESLIKIWTCSIQVNALQIFSFILLLFWYWKRWVNCSVAKFALRNIICILTFSIISQHSSWRRYMKYSLTKDKDDFTLWGQYHGCWCHGAARSQGISSHVTDQIILEYSGFTTRWVNETDNRCDMNLSWYPFWKVQCFLTTSPNKTPSLATDGLIHSLIF